MCKNLLDTYILCTIVSFVGCLDLPMAKCFPMPLSVTTSGKDDLTGDTNESIHSRLGSRENKQDGKDGNVSLSVTPRRYFRSFSLKLKRMSQKSRGRNSGFQTHAQETTEHLCAERLQHIAGPGHSKVMNKLDEAGDDELPLMSCNLFCGKFVQRNEGISPQPDVAREITRINIMPTEEGITQLSCSSFNRNDDGALELRRNFNILRRFSSFNEAGGSAIVQVNHPPEIANREQFASRQIVEGVRRLFPETQMQCGCFANGKRDKLKGWESRTRGRGKTVDQEKVATEGFAKVEQSAFPDDIIEMFLARVPFSTLVKARLVCKKWRVLTMSQHFLQMRETISSQKPWLFVFGLSRDGVCMGQIQALDPTVNRWHAIRAEPLSGRFLYSVASIGTRVYIIGGCSSLTNSSGRRLNKGSPRTYKGVLVYTPLTSTWEKVSSMNKARAMPVVGVFEIKGEKNLRDTCYGSNLDDGKHCYCYIDNQGSCSSDNGLGRCSGHEMIRSNGASTCCSHYRMEEFATEAAGPRRQEMWVSHIENNTRPFRNASLSSSRIPGFMASESGLSCERLIKERNYGLIVVGGQGASNEPLDSAEIYDPATNKWREIASLPANYGVVCAGAVCNGIFYVFTETDKLAAYDFEQNIWTNIQVPNPPDRLHEYMPKLIASKDRLFLLGVAWMDSDRNGGIGREKATRMIWELNPMLLTWSEICKHPDAPLDWNALFVSAGDQIFGLEMFKIFGQVLDFITVCEISGSVIKWSRLSRMQMTNDIDVSSCITKTAVIAQL